MRGNMLLHWLLYHTGFQRARTQLSQPETEALTNLAAGRQCIVELGVFEGATSRRLREAMSQTGTLWCIDPFYPGRFGFSYGHSITVREVNRTRNGSVVFIRQLSHEAIARWNGEIEMLFIDADHSYDAVRRDWLEWSPFVRPGGFIALHDSRVCPDRLHTIQMGPVRLAKEIRSKSDEFRLREEVDSLTVFERIQ